MTNELIPVRINLQIRDGIQNELARFDAEVFNSRPSRLGTGIDHDMSTYSIIGGLAMALRDQVVNFREKTTVPDEAEAWLASIRDWTFA